MLYGPLLTLTSSACTLLGPVDGAKCVDDPKLGTNYCMDVVHYLRCTASDHPLAQLLLQACEDQQKVVGSGMKTMVVLSGRLLTAAVQLQDKGIPAHIIVRAFRRSVALCDRLKPTLCVPLLRAAGLPEAPAPTAGQTSAALHRLFQGMLDPADGQSREHCAGVRCALNATSELSQRGLACNLAAVQVVRVTGPSADTSFVSYGMAFQCSSPPDGLTARAVSSSGPPTYQLQRHSGLQMVSVWGDLDFKGDQASDVAQQLLSSQVSVVMTTGLIFPTMVDALEAVGVLHICSVPERDMDRLCSVFGHLHVFAEDLLTWQTTPIPSDNVAHIDMTLFQFTQNREPARRRSRDTPHGPWVVYYAVLAPAPDLVPVGLHASVVAFICSPTEFLGRKVRVTFYNTFAKLANMGAYKMVTPGAGYTEACWMAWLREFVDKKNAGDHVEDCSTLVGTYDARETECIALVADCLQYCLLQCTLNTGQLPNEAIDSVVRLAPAYRAHVNDRSAGGLPAHILQAHPELQGVTVHSKITRLIPLPPLQSPQEGGLVSKEVLYGDLHHWEDAQGRYSALIRAVTVSCMAVQTSILHLG